MAEIPLHAKVEYLDGHHGESVMAIVDRKTRRVTHFVVQVGGVEAPRLVPMSAVVGVDARVLQLNCEKKQAADFPPFTEREYVATDMTEYW